MRTEEGSVAGICIYEPVQSNNSLNVAQCCDKKLIDKISTWNCGFFFLCFLNQRQVLAVRCPFEMKPWVISCAKLPSRSWLRSLVGLVPTRRTIYLTPNEGQMTRWAAPTLNSPSMIYRALKRYDKQNQTLFRSPILRRWRRLPHFGEGLTGIKPP